MTITSLQRCATEATASLASTVIMRRSMRCLRVAGQALLPDCFYLECREDRRFCFWLACRPAESARLPEAKLAPETKAAILAALHRPNRRVRLCCLTYETAASSRSGVSSPACTCGPSL